MKRRVPLARRITLLISVLVIAILAVVIQQTGSRLRSTVDAIVLGDAGQITAARSSEIGRFIEELRWQLRMIALRPELLSKKKETVEAAIYGLKGATSPEVTGTLFAWPDGSYISSAGAHGSLLDRDYFKAIMSGGSDFVISSPVISKSLGVYQIVVAQAIKAPDGKVAAMIAFQLKLSTLSEIAQSIKIGESGYGWIVEGKGLVIAHRDEKAVMSLNLLDSNKLGYKGLEALGKTMLETDSGRGSWVRPDGIAFTTYFSSVPNSPGWKLGVSQPTQEVEKAANSLRLTLLVIFAIGLALTVLASALLGRYILEPINRASRGFKELAEGEGDLTVSVRMDRNDEIGDLVSEINTFLAKLREIMIDLKGAQSDLSGIGDELDRSVLGAGTAVGELTGDIAAVRDRGIHQASSVEESSSAVSQIARNIASLDELISSQAASITEASASIEQMVGNISSVTATIDKMASEFSDLSSASDTGKNTLARAAELVARISDQSRSLLEANEVIAGIASSTNLLAMNAAIEAAHAGEAGKGFSVVADEIRRLAETASGQSKTIGDELRIIQEAIVDIVGATKESEDAFSLVAGKIADTDSIVKEVSQAMAEQGEGSKQILEALHEMNDITSQVKNGSSEMSVGNTAVLEEMTRLRDAAFDVRERVEAMATSSGAIESNVKSVAQMTKGTGETIKRMERAIGRFKV